MKTKSNRGGARPGAGRPTADNAKDLVSLTVYVRQSDITKAEKLGEGNKSLGIRRALNQVTVENWRLYDLK